MHKVQLLAAQAVGQVLAGRNLNQALDELRRASPQLTPQQRAALQDMSYSALRWLGRLDALLGALLQRPLTDERVRCLLLVALGQLEYGKSAPYAVVDNAARAAVTLQQPWAKGLVNAVLRNFLRRRDALSAEIDKDEVARLSYPGWWIAKLRNQYPAAWETMLTAGNGRPPMTLRVNIRKGSRAAYLDRLAANEIAAHAVGDYGVILERPLPVEKLPGFAEGLVSVQDAGAQHAAPLLDVQGGMRVLDACSAPGGKTAHLLELADIELLSLDNDEARLGRVRDNLRRLGLKAEVKQGDAAHPDSWWDDRLFDRILADVPCSASGIVRRHPDIKWLRREADIASFGSQQTAILRGLWSTLAKGGKLLYATCSVFQEENQRQVETFLAERPDARRLPLAGLEKSGLEGDQLLPCDAHDGFYYALLQKV
ncbi:MAG: 16S rRNA (cytosine(967)-C(5))-methyltransferase [Methylophilales bacterium RIFCSPHIGHO2_02_FULL_57_10]|nr:MAG: 16S rRNA (cytosine(967)-C(5))-methyltransferase [Methylophilales bacterium RIFCSPHIGHO2_02_FULL_57_10]